jgi:hypothetical protein
VRSRLAAAAVAFLTVATPAAAAVPAAHEVVSIRTVGPLFFPSVAGALPALHGPHFCSAGVVHSRGHDLVITAAHCVYGPGLTIEFAPGFHDGIAPYGVWEVRRIYLEPGWRTSRDPHDDVALLQLAPHAGREIEDVVGAHSLASPSVGAYVTVDGYPAGSGGRPITCANELYATQGYPSFDCSGYVGGVSGGPWVQGSHVVGVTGGLEQGGCTDSTSYSAPFGAGTLALLRRAEAGGPGDLAPVAFLANAC